LINPPRKISRDGKLYTRRPIIESKIIELASELAAAMLQEATIPQERETAIEVTRVYQAYETLKRQAGCIDFGDLVSLPVLLLERNAAIRNHFESQYDHVLVDEYQDVNRSSIRLLQALCGDGENLWVVGDAKQSIYRFRGAASCNLIGGIEVPAC
jgi:superfamily I DNA/RNA helicase